MPPLTDRDAARWLLEELESSRLEVCKVPGREGGYVRVCVSVNAEWYRGFCGDWVRPRRRRYRRPRTIIKRCHTVRALQRIVGGNPRGVYCERLLPLLVELRARIARSA